MKAAKETGQKEVATKRTSKLTISSILREIADFGGWEVIFQVLLYAFLIWGGYSLYLVYRFHHEPGYVEIPKFSIRDFRFSFIPTVFFFIYKRLCLKMFFGYMKSTLDPVKFPTEEERNMRATKGSVWLSCIIYYIFSTGLAFYLFKDSFFFPTSLGGSHQCSEIYKYTPYVPEIPYATLFYQIQFGWHFHTLVDHVVYKWREPKFWEMFLHHAVAVFLIFFSYLSNQVAVGILVLITHDPCDIGLYGSRLYNDRKGKIHAILVMIYGYFMVSWMYLRLFVFPKCIVGAGFMGLAAYPSNDLMYTVYMYLLVMLSALVGLHLYWFVYIIRIVIVLMFGSSDPNVYDKSRKSV